MPTPLTTAVRRLRTLAAPPVDGLSDPDLLTRFRTSADEAAFAALVARHGPAVLGVCRRVLGDRHAADDAFQATFLVLARKAGGVRNPAALGCWLHGVAFRVASKLRGRLARLPRTGDVPDVATSGDDVSWREVRRVLDEEVTRLPDRLRVPVLLCYFEGKTRDEAADAIGCKVTTLRGRLEDGRERLRARLARRGVELSAALLAVSAAADAVAVDDALRTSTVATAMTLAGGTMLTKFALITVLVLGLGTAFVVSQGPGTRTPAADPPKAAEPPPKPADDWGDPDGDLRLRLRTKATFRPDEALTFDLDLRNVGRAARTLQPVPQTCVIEFDRELYLFPGFVDSAAPHRRIAAGGEVVPFMPVRVDDTWRTTRPKAGVGAESVPLRLTPGKHTVRARFPVGDRAVVSKEVTIEVAAPPLDPKVAALALGADRIWVVPSPTRAKPVPEPVRVLKGPPAKSPTVFDLRLLPGDDPKKQWIVFLQAEEDGVGVPVVKPVAGPTWHVPFDEATAAALAEQLMPAGWGDEVDGLRLGLRLRAGRVEAGQPVVVELVLRNLRNVDRTFEHHRMNIYDYWPATSFQVIAPDNTTWGLEKPSGQMDEFDRLAEFPLKAGGSYVHAVRLDRWPAASADLKKHPVSPRPNLFTAPGEYRIICKAGFQSSPTSSAVTLTVTQDEWAPAAAGVQARVRLTRPAVAAGDPLEFALDLRNTGAKDFVEGPVPYECEVEYDGQKYTFNGPIDYKATSKTVKPNGQIDGWTTVTTDRFWTTNGPPGGVPHGVPLVLAEGKHTLRVSYQMTTPNKMKVVSQKAEFVVGKRDWGEPADGIELRARLAAAPTAGGPLAVAVDLRNQGTGVYNQGSIPECAEVEVDGRWYRHAGPVEIDAPVRQFYPTMRIDDFVAVRFDGKWVAEPEKEKPADPAPLKLAPGKHTVRVAYPLWGDEQKRVKPVSLPVEFTIPDPEWGAAADGLQARVRVTNAKPVAGDPLTFELDLRNRGTKALDEAPVPYSCEIDLDGRIYTYRAPISYRSSNLTIKPDGQMDGWTKVTTDEWWAHTGQFGGGWTGGMPPPRGLDGKVLPPPLQTIPLALTPGKHTLRVSYQMTTPNKMKVVSQTAEFVVGKPEWGPAAEGIRARVRPAKATFREGEPLAFSLDLRNEGTKDLVEAPVPYSCQFDLDGRPFGYTGPVDYSAKIVTLKPGEQIDDWTKVTTDRWWMQTLYVAADLDLTPGPHTLRVSYQMTAPNKMLVVSQTAEFTVEPVLVPTADRVVVATFDDPTTMGLKPVKTLKGPHNDWQSDVQRVTLPPASKGIPNPGFDREWLVFLKAEEDGRAVPKLSALTVDWYKPATPAAVQAVRDALAPPTDHGPALNGLTLALRRVGGADDDCRFEVVLTNRGKGPVRVLQQRYNVYDYWPFLTFTVTRPDGTTFVLSKPDGEFKREDYIGEQALGPAESYAHTVRLDRWVDRSRNGTERASELTRPGSYKVKASYAVPGTFKNLSPKRLDDHVWWVGEVASNELVVGVPAADGWGEAVDGLACRLSNPAVKGKTIAVDLDLWNRGKLTWAVVMDSSFAELEVDGVWYVPKVGRPIDQLSAVFKPGARKDQLLKLATDDGWIEKTPEPDRAAARLVLEPGKHRVRAAFAAYRAGTEVRVVSNAVEVSVGE